MKATATSTFHDCMEPVVFTGLKEGVNIRRLLGPRARYCLDYSNSNSHVCGCGYPISFAKWEAPEGYVAYPDCECGPDGREGRGYIRIVIRPESDYNL